MSPASLVGPRERLPARRVDQLKAAGDPAPDALHAEAEVDESVEAPEGALREEVEREERADLLRAQERRDDDDGDRSELGQASRTLEVQRPQPAEPDLRGHDPFQGRADSPGRFRIVTSIELARDRAGHRLEFLLATLAGKGGGFLGPPRHDPDRRERRDRYHD